MSIVVKWLDGSRRHLIRRYTLAQATDGVAAPPKRGIAPQFFAHVCCGQTAGWMKTPLGMEVDFGPGYIVLDGDPAPPQKGHSTPAPFFVPYGRPSQLLLSSCSQCSVATLPAGEAHLFICALYSCCASTEPVLYWWRCGVLRSIVVFPNVNADGL